MKNQYKVAVLIYPAGDEHLVFKDDPEVVMIETDVCTSPADIETTTAIAKRRAAKAIEDYEAPLDIDNDTDNL